VKVYKKQLELLGFGLKVWVLLHQDTKSCFFRNRQNEMKEFFSQEDDVVFCNALCYVTEALGHKHGPT
jgi:hypothetical protein